MIKPLLSISAVAFSANAQWISHKGINCYSGWGGEPYSSSDTPREGLSLSECQEACDSFDNCGAVTIRVDGQQQGFCWLRKWIEPTECQESAGSYDSYAKFWMPHQGLNCYRNNGGTPIDPNDNAIRSLTLDQCKSRCEGTPGCSSVTVRADSSGGAGDCYLRAPIQATRCQSNGDYNTWSRPPAKRLGSFLVLGDWGYDSAVHGSVRPGCQSAIAQSMQKKFAELGDVKFVVNVGDSFYPGGIAFGDDNKWNARWRNMYGSTITDLPWFGVYGNHDYQGQDRCVCQEDTSQCSQVNPKFKESGGWIMPDVNYYDDRYLEEFDLELVMMDLNAVDYLDSGSTWGLCQYTQCHSQCDGVLQKRKQDALNMFADRYTNSQAKNIIAVSHYPTGYLKRAGYNDLMGQLSDGSKHAVQYFAGHGHNVDQNSPSIGNNTQWMVGGGGGWGCDGNQQGFVVGEIHEDKTITTYSWIVNYGQCCYGVEHRTNLTKKMIYR